MKAVVVPIWHPFPLVRANSDVAQLFEHWMSIPCGRVQAAGVVGFPREGA